MADTTTPQPLLSSTAPLGYCTNVHAGANLEQTRANLARHAVAVKQRVAPTGQMGVGLWLSAGSAHELLEQPAELESFARWLNESGLVPYTFNGFPYGDFHQEVVKHAVYLPPWGEAARREYTLALVQILHRLLPPGVEGSISTLPLAWGEPAPSEAFLTTAAAELAKVAEALATLEQQTGRLIYVCLEPEPGCVLQQSEDVARFFTDHLFPGRDSAMIARYLRVCHDICHHAVMFEDPAAVLNRYRQAGIAIGKMQISAAICANFAGRGGLERMETIVQLETFAEARYLHQSVIRRGEEKQFHQDLDTALVALWPQECLDNTVDEVRVHFHVPIYLRSFGRLGTTQAAIGETLRALRPGECQHFEVETYAWQVVPPALQQASLADGIAQELLWLAGQRGFSGRQSPR